MYEQLRAMWQSRDKEQLFVRGYLKTKSRRGCINGASEPGPTVMERWFTLLGHSLFYCTQKEATEFSGVLLTDIFSPVLARVDSLKFDSFHAESTQQVARSIRLLLYLAIYLFFTYTALKLTTGAATAYMTCWLLH